MTGARDIMSLDPGWKSLLVECILPPAAPPLPPSQVPDIDDGLLEKPLPARPTHFNLIGGGMDNDDKPEETRRPSGPKDDWVFLLVSMVWLAEFNTIDSSIGYR